ncbi:MAG: sigma-70 family RNA polymerase sigma factor [Hyphomicrobiaceae bacterium]
MSQLPEAPQDKGAHRSRAGGPRLVVSNETTDAILVKDALDGDRRAFQMLVERHLTRTVNVARRLLGGDSDAEDVAQESFVRLWNRLGDLEIGASGVGPWLRRVTFNLCMDRKRSARTIVPDALETMASSDDQQRTLEEQALSGRVDTALQGLPERQRAAIVLFHYEGYAVKEIAEMMDASADAVESLLGRARRALKEDLKDDWMALLPEGHGAATTHSATRAED